MSKAEIERKKNKALKRKFYALLHHEFYEQKQNPPMHHMRPGRYVRPSNAKFYAESIEKPKFYLYKTAIFLAPIIGNEILRILSNKQFAAKDILASVTTNMEGKYDFANSSLTKWDKELHHISPGRNPKTPLEILFDPGDLSRAAQFYHKSMEKGKILESYTKNYARLAGVLSIGFSDYNYDNIAISKKTLRPLIIDSHPLLNASTQIPQRIIGSAFTNDFLRILLGNKMNLLQAHRTVTINLTLLQLESKASYEEKYNEAFMDAYKKDIDIILFEEIKENISKNPFLKDCFMEFMQGIEDTIELANDDGFWKEFAKRYNIITLPDIKTLHHVIKQKTINELIAIFKQNAAEIKEQYILFLQLFEDIKQETTQKVIPSKYAISQEEFTALLKKDYENLATVRRKNEENLELYSKYELAYKQIEELRLEYDCLRKKRKHSTSKEAHILPSDSSDEENADFESTPEGAKIAEIAQRIRDETNKFESHKQSFFELRNLDFKTICKQDCKNIDRKMRIIEEKLAQIAPAPAATARAACAAIVQYQERPPASGDRTSPRP